MRDLFRPINTNNNNQSTEYKQEEKASSSIYNNMDTYIECQEDNIYDLYYQEHREQCEWEAFIEEMELIGLLII